MIEHIRQLIARYAQHGIFVDTNILLLYLIGCFDPDLISRFKRTRQFTAEDFNTLLLLLRPFNKFVTMPNVLTEVSNLSGQLGEPAKSLYFQMFGARIALMEEYYIESGKAAKQSDFIRMGLTDAGIFELAKDQYLVLTDDFRLSQSLQKKGVDVINFNHIRPLGWS